MATLEERLHSINLVQEMLSSSRDFEALPPALRHGVAKVLRDYPSQQALVRALEPGQPNITWDAQCALFDARQLLEYVANYCSSPLDRGLIRFALRSYPETLDLIKAAAAKEFPRQISSTPAR